MRVVAEGLRFPEGPIALDDGSVLLVEIERGTLSRVNPDGGVEVVADCGSGPNGAAMGPDGAVYVCNNGGFSWRHVDGMLLPGVQPETYDGGSIQRVDIESGEVRTLYTECDGWPLRGPNDLVFDRQGGFYFTDLGKGRERDFDRGGIYYAKADGSSVIPVCPSSDNPQRCRPFTRRGQALLRRDDDRSGVVLGARLTRGRT